MFRRRSFSKDREKEKEKGEKGEKEKHLKKKNSKTSVPPSKNETNAGTGAGKAASTSAAATTLASEMVEKEPSSSSADSSIESSPKTPEEGIPPVPPLPAYLNGKNASTTSLAQSLPDDDMTIPARRSSLVFSSSSRPTTPDSSVPPVPSLPSSAGVDLSSPSNSSDDKIPPVPPLPAGFTPASYHRSPSPPLDIIPPVPPLPTSLINGSTSRPSSSRPSSSSSLSHSSMSPSSASTLTVTADSMAAASNPNLPQMRGRYMTSPRNSGSSLSSRSTSQPPGSSRSSIATPDGTLSSRTSNSSLNVKFAPLPELGPRRRKSSTPLGMASRGQMMRKRRQVNLMGQEEYPDGQEVPVEQTNPMWTKEEVHLHLMRQRQALEDARRRAAYEPMGREEDENEGDEEDPLLALGRVMKFAFKRMASGKDAKKKPEIDEKDIDDENTPGVIFVDPQKVAGLHSILAQPIVVQSPTDVIVQEERVWDNEADTLFLQKVIVTDERSSEEKDSGSEQEHSDVSLSHS